MRSKIFSKLILYFILTAILALTALSLTACGNGGQEMILDIPIPPVTIMNNVPTDAPTVSPTEPAPVIAADVPNVDEYTIFLDFEPESRIIRGIESVIYTNRSGAGIQDLTFRAPFEFMDIIHVSHDNEELRHAISNGALTIRLPRTLGPDETIQIRIQFEAEIPLGNYRTGSNEQVVWIGDFLPTGMKGPLPDIANYTVEITTPIGYIVAGTGAKTETYLDDHKITTFTAQMTRDFAFAISPYFQRATLLTGTGREVNLYYYTYDLPEERILNAAAEAMAFFEDTVGAYPYPQLSIIETDMLGGGSSFSAVIFMDSIYLQYSRELSTLRQEIGHQWFSVIISVDPATDGWLMGGLTHFLQTGLHGYPIRRLEAQPIYALYQEMGSENFRLLLREYFGRFAFRTASTPDFILLAEEVHGESLGEFFEYWVILNEDNDY